MTCYDRHDLPEPRLCFEFGLELDDVTSQKAMAAWPPLNSDTHQFPRETFNTQERIETDKTAGWTPVANRSVTSRIELLNFK